MLSIKQDEFIHEPLARINLLYGSVSSGKTHVSLLRYALLVGEYDKKTTQHIMIGKTITSLKNNALIPLQSLLGTKNFTFSIGQKCGLLFGRVVRFEGANDDRAEGKVRGSSYSTAYVDELTLIPEGFYHMLLTRLRQKNAKLIATTNPDSPLHYVNTDIVLNDRINRKCFKFLLDDNTFLDAEYIEETKKEHSGVFYERFILGNFVLAEGLIYSNFSIPRHVVKTEHRPYETYWVSFDFGVKHPCVFLLWGRLNGISYLIKEYYWHGEKNGQKSDAEYYQDLLDFTDGYMVQKVYLDNAPISASFNVRLIKSGKFSCTKAKNEVLAGIQEVSTALNLDLIRINDCCFNTIREKQMYVWAEGKEEPLKENDDCMDALRYYVKTSKIAMPKRQSLL